MLILLAFELLEELKNEGTYKEAVLPFRFGREKKKE